MGSCMVEKFRHYIELSDDEEALLLRLEEKKVKYKSGETIRGKGHESEDIYTISDGWTYIANTIDQGTRSVFDLKLNGDFVGLGEISFDNYLYDFVALTDVEVCPFPKQHLNEIFKKSEKLNRTFYSIISREQAILFERLISLGRRNALEKVAHLILEFSTRKSAFGVDIEGSFEFPIKQDLIADMLGLSNIHVNRSMNELKRHKYIDYDRRNIQILDKQRLINLANFNVNFLKRPDVSWHT